MEKRQGQLQGAPLAALTNFWPSGPSTDSDLLSHEDDLRGFYTNVGAGGHGLQALLPLLASLPAGMRRSRP